MRLKKILGVVTAAVLALSMTLTAFAAPSVSVSGIVTYGNGIDANGTAIMATLTDVAEEYSDAMADVRRPETLKALLGDAYKDTMSVVDIRDVTVPEGTPMPVKLTFNVPGVTPTTAVAVLHYDIEKKVWEVVDSTAGQGIVTATFTSLSPVAFVVDKGTAGTVTSPNTGENSYVVLFGAAAVAAACGVAVLSKKKKA